MNKNSKFLLFIASMDIVGMVFKLVVSIIAQGYITIPQGWMSSVFISMLSIYIFVTSEIKDKTAFIILGFMAYMILVIIIAALATCGVAYIGGTWYGT